MLYLHHKRKIISALLFGALIAFGGCKKMIAIDPPIDTVNTTVVFNDPDKITAALSGLYSTMMANTGNPTFSNGYMSIYGGMMADELDSYMSATEPLGYQFYTNKLLLDNGVVKSVFWDVAYKTIYTANSIMEGASLSTSLAVTDSIRQQLNGECRFARAFSLFYLTNLFGDIPLPLTTNVLAESTQKRQPVEKVNQQIIQDLKIAIESLPDNFEITKGEKVRPNKYAAIALLARLYLYNQQWKDAAEQADILINSGKFNLTSLENTFAATSDEAIWQLKYSITGILSDNNFLPEASAFTPALSLSQIPADAQEQFLDPEMFASATFMVMPLYYLTENTVAAFEPGDLRLAKWVDSLRSPQVEPWNGRKYRFAQKYPRLLADGSSRPFYYTVMRLAEQYLIRAEARAQSGDLAGAAGDINILRSRAGLPDTKATSRQELLDAVAHERQIELFAEWGHRWFDLKRTGKAASILGRMPAKQPWSDDKLLLFIPTEEIKNDPALTQNPGYSW